MTGIATQATPPRKSFSKSATAPAAQDQPKKKTAKPGSSIKLQIDFPGGVRLGLEKWPFWKPSTAQDR